MAENAHVRPDQQSTAQVPAQSKRSAAQAVRTKYTGMDDEEHGTAKHAGTRASKRILHSPITSSLPATRVCISSLSPSGPHRGWEDADPVRLPSSHHSPASLDPASGTKNSLRNRCIRSTVTRLALPSVESTPAAFIFHCISDLAKAQTYPLQPLARERRPSRERNQRGSMADPTSGGFIKVVVPEGFLPQSTPCDPSTRIPSSDIVIEELAEGDLVGMAYGLHSCFPEIWWGKHEPLGMRAPKELREGRFALRLKPLVRHPHIHLVKAVERGTGEMMGVAGWHIPEKKSTVCAFRREALKGEREGGFGFQEMMGWSDEEVEEMWQGVNVEAWEGEFSKNDRVRAEEMGDTPHWYLAPLFVFDKFRGRGVGKVLLGYAAEQADKHDPPLPCYLEALPNARPVYMHEGYEGVEGPGREAVMIRRARHKKSA